MVREVNDWPRGEPAQIILFDGACNLCNKTVDFIIRHDAAARFRFAALQSPAGRRYLQPAGSKTGPPASIILLDGGSVYRESDAVLRILGLLPAPWRYLASLRRIPRPLRNGVYRLIGAWRYRLFGRRDTCRVPSAAEQSRFLENGGSGEG